MPFQSEQQRKYLWANEPEIAKRWEKYPKGYNTGGVSHLFRSKSAKGGYIRPEDSGVLGLADGGQLVKPGPGRPGYQGWPGPGGGAPEATTEDRDDRDYEEQAVGTPYENIYTAPTYPTYPDEGGERDDPGSVSYEPPVSYNLEEEKKDYVKVPAHKSKFGKKWDRPEQYVTTGEAKTIAELDAYVDENFGMFSEFNMVKQVVNLLQDQVPLIGKFLPEFFPTTDIHGNVISSTDQVTGADLGFFQDKKWDYLWKKGPQDRDRDGGDNQSTTISTIANKFPTKEEMMEAARRAYEMLYGDKGSTQIPEDTSKRDAYLAAFRQKYLMGDTESVAKGGRVPQGYNTGGLSNLFRLKNK